MGSLIVLMDSSPGKSPALLALEDRANSHTHAIGSGMAIAGLAMLAVLSALTGDAWKIVSTCIFGATLVLLYTASSLYHAVHRPALRRALRILDHVSISLLIAGTYTPFVLVNLRATVGWWIFAAIWSLALSGVVAELFLTGRFKKLSTLLYVAMGWIIVLAIGPLVRTLPHEALVLLVAGGLSYTLGAAFYLLDRRMPFGHAVWHVFVMGGSVCHFLSIVLGVLPYRG